MGVNKEREYMEKGDSTKLELVGARLLMLYLTEFADDHGLEIPRWISKKWTDFQKTLDHNIKS